MRSHSGSGIHAKVAWARLGGGALLTVTVSVAIGLAAAPYVLPRGASMPRQDLYLLVVWTLPEAVLVILAGKLMRRRVSNTGVLRSLAATGVGVLIGGAWSFCASSGAIIGLEAPIFWCWVWGAVVGLLAVLVPATRSGLAAAAVALLGLAALSTGVISYTNRVPTFYVYARPGVILEEIASGRERGRSSLDQFLSTPHDLKLLTMPGVSRVGLERPRGDTVIAVVTFRWDATRKQKLAVLTYVRAEPFVLRIADTITFAGPH